MAKKLFLLMLIFSVIIPIAIYQVQEAQAVVSLGGSPGGGEEISQPQEDLFQGWDMEGLARDLAKNPYFELYYQRAKAEIHQPSMATEALIQRPKGRPQTTGQSGEEPGGGANVTQPTLQGLDREGIPKQGGGQEMNQQVAPRKRVDLYISFTCSYCWSAWELLRADGMQRLREKGDTVDFHVRPLVGSSEEAIIGLIFDKLQYMNSESSYTFLDFIAKKKYSIGQARFLGEINQWMVENLGMDIKKFSESITEEDRKRLLLYDQEFKAAGGNMTPTIVVDGKIDNLFFD